LRVTEGPNALSESTIYWWVETFKDGDESIERWPHSGYPCKAVIPRKIAKVEELVNDKYICKMDSILSFGNPNFLLYHSYGNVWVIIYQFLHLCNLSWGDSFARTSQAGVIFQCSHPHLRML